MHADNSTDIPIIYVKASELLEPEGQEEFDKLWASLAKHQQESKVQRGWLGQSCAVAPIIRMDKVMNDVMQNIARRMFYDVLKDNYGTEFADIVSESVYGSTEQ